MRELLTTKQVARAIQVSESSVKRWCDKGMIPTQYTAGGHRRIPLSGLLAFLRSSGHELVRPDQIGLPAIGQAGVRGTAEAYERLMDALLRGDEDACRQLAMDMYLGEFSLATLCDVVFARAFETIGDRWHGGTAEIYQERRGCEIMLRVLHDLRAMVPPPPPDSPLAIGGAVEGDQYQLATTMVALVLRDARWRSWSLGDNLPFTTLAAAIRDHRPRLFWLSVSHLADERSFLRDYGELYEGFGGQVAFVVGGRALTSRLREQMRYGAYCDNMRHLESFAQSIRTVAERFENHT